MDLLCKVCDRSFFENESEDNHYLATLQKRNDKNMLLRILNCMMLIKY